MDGVPVQKTTGAMKIHKIYEPDDKLIDIIKDNYAVLQSLGSFGISLGFGDKTVKEVCEKQGVDTLTFLTVVNFTESGYMEYDITSRLSVGTLLDYLKASHNYYIGFELPFIRRELADAIDKENNVGQLIMKLYDEYARSVTNHMRYEEKNVFPYVRALLEKKPVPDYNIDTFSKHHGQIDMKLRELKSIIIKYLPPDTQHSHQLGATLYDIYNCEQWLAQHASVEDNIFIPAIKRLETCHVQDTVSVKISHLLGDAADKGDELSDREKDVVACLVQGMTSKEIANRLFISINTVNTHRRNIARKLQIHSSAGLIIYAIANNLVDRKPHA